MRSSVFLTVGSTPTGRDSLRITRSLLSALGTRGSAYTNVTTGVVNIDGDVVTFSGNNRCVIVFGPRVVGGSRPCSARRDYLSLLNNPHGYGECGAVGIR